MTKSQPQQVSDLKGCRVQNIRTARLGQGREEVEEESTCTNGAKTEDNEEQKPSFDSAIAKEEHPSHSPQLPNEIKRRLRCALPHSVARRHPPRPALNVSNASWASTKNPLRILFRITSLKMLPTVVHPALIVTPNSQSRANQ